MLKFLKTISLFLVLALVFSLAACGGKAADEQNAGSSTGTQQEKSSDTAPKEPVKLKLMLDNGDDTRKQINTKYIQANLPKELPGYEVEVELVPADFSTKIKVLNSTGDLPDVLMCQGTIMAPPLINSKSLVDLNPYITKDGFADKFKIKNLLAPWKDGKLYTLDCGSDAYFVPRMFYHKDIFSKYNLNVPVTFDEFVNTCKTLKSKGLVPVAIYGKEGWAVLNYLFTMMVLADKPEVMNDLINGKTDFSNPVCQDALKRIVTLANEGVFQPGATTTEYGAVSELFTSGKAAMYQMNSWELPAMEKVADVDFMNFPQVNPEVDMSKVTQIYGAPLKGYAVCSSSKNIEAAVKLAEYCAMQEATFFNKEQKAPSGIETGINIEGVSPFMQKNLTQIEGCTTKVNVLTYNNIKAKALTDLQVASAKLLTGKYSPEQFAKDMNPVFLDGMKD